MNAPLRNASALDAAPLTAAGLTSRAMLSALKVTQWTARKLDKAATTKVVADAGAHSNAGRFNKTLVAPEALARIVSATNKAREVHYARTLPWLDDGARILPAAGYADYSAAMRTVRQDFEEAAREFIAAYPGFREAARTRLGTMYQPADYPEVADVEARFSFSIRVMPLPDATDFRVALPQDVLDAIKADAAQDSRNALAGAMADVRARVVETVGRMAERLAAYKPATNTDKAEGVFRDSLVDNVRELADVLPSFNLTGDAGFAALIERIRGQLCGLDAAALRNDPAARAETAAAAAAIVADVSDFML